MLALSTFARRRSLDPRIVLVERLCVIFDRPQREIGRRHGEIVRDWRQKQSETLSYPHARAEAKSQMKSLPRRQTTSTWHGVAVFLQAVADQLVGRVVVANVDVIVAINRVLPRFQCAPPNDAA